MRRLPATPQHDGLDRLLPDACERLEADLKAGAASDQVQKEVFRVVFDDPLAETSAQKVDDLLSGHFKADGLEVDSSEVTKLIATSADQPPKK